MEQATCISSKVQRLARLAKVPALVVVAGLLAAACGGGDAPSSVADATPEAAGQQESGGAVGGGSDDPSSADVSIVASFAQPSGDLAPSAITISPDGSQAAVAYLPPATGQVSSTDIVTFDTTSGAEVSRVVIEDSGPLGVEDLFWSSGGLRAMFRNSEFATVLVAIDSAGAVGPPVVIDPVECGQYLGGSLDTSAEVFYTIVPGGFCRVDLRSGAGLTVSANEYVVEIGQLFGIVFADDGALVVSLNGSVSDGDFVQLSLEVDPATLLPVDGNPVDEPLPSPLLTAATAQLDTVVATMSSDRRVAVSADGATAVLVQDGRVDVMR